MKFIKIFLMVCSICSNLLSTQKTTVIKAGKIIDVENGKVLENQIILIENEIIKSISSAGKIEIPTDATVIDLSNATLLPGFIDCHTHLTSQLENYGDEFRKSPIDVAVTSHIYAKNLLLSGFTACRILGSAELIDVALKKAIESGKIIGPRIFAAGVGLSATGGHGDLSGFSPYLTFQNFNGVVDGVDEIRKKIRWNVKYGADVIKFTATAGVLSEEESYKAPQFSFEEMKAIVDESKMWGKKVAAHAHGSEGIKLAVEAGVASIEHGSIMDDETIELMFQKGTYLVPTVIAGDAVEALGKKIGLPQLLMEKANQVNKLKRDTYRRAIKKGVKFAFGTDSGIFPHGENGKEFKLLTELGMSPMNAIKSATINSADLVGEKEKIGSLQAGKFADIVAVTEDPLKNISALENILFVMKNGQVYKNQISK